MSLQPVGGSSETQLLSVAIQQGTTFLTVSYKGTQIINNGPSVQIQSNLWTSIKVSLGYDQITVSNGVSSTSGGLVGTASPGVFSYLFASNPFDNPGIGNIRRVEIAGIISYSIFSSLQSLMVTSF